MMIVVSTFSPPRSNRQGQASQLFCSPHHIHEGEVLNLMISNLQSLLKQLQDVGHDDVYRN